MTTNPADEAWDPALVDALKLRLERFERFAAQELTATRLAAVEDYIERLPTGERRDPASVLASVSGDDAR
jgi:hypothetical protein